MNDAELQRDEELFTAACEMTDPAARAAYLERACGGDSASRIRVERLLAAQMEAEHFFTESGTALNPPNPSLGISRELPSLPGGAAIGEEPVGTRIGRYKLIRKIGEGGCGVVYMAEQEHPVRRWVALKIIKLGMETKSVIARFEAERQALAMMDHPNIARVFDAGATDRGPPYFVMELVRGVRITEYCDRNRLPIRERLELFVQVCHAIQHAHQKGIIHGDVKPSNILVTLHDGLPLPKVIDFGIAKATDVRPTDKLLYTGYAQLIGTPAYMSPEQVAMNSQSIDTRSDVYSLGVLLYELLTGTTPFDAKLLLEAGIDEMRRILQEREPQRPSVRLGGLDSAEALRAGLRRRTDVPRLASALRGDLDWIAMKALDKDRRRRYETANGLAEDIQRHLQNEPVVACPPSRLYRFQKLVRRNRVVFAAGGAVAAALVTGLGTSTWLFLREREAHHRAVAAEQQQARLRHEAENREQITQAALLISQDRLSEADGLLDEISLTQATVEGAAVYRYVGEWHALHHRWTEAANRLEILLRVNALDGWDAVSLDYLRCGPTLVELGDEAHFEQFRHDMIARFTASPNPFADRILKISLLAPASRDVLEALGPLVQDTTKAFAEADASNDPFPAAWRAVALALWEYRRGEAEKAIAWASRCLAYPEANASRTAAARAILALAHRQLGRRDEARSEVAAVRELADNKFKGWTDRGNPINGFWFDWFFARILLREAAVGLDELPAGAPPPGS